MLSFATEFPVVGASAIHDFLAVIAEWISGSPHNRFVADDLAPMRAETPWSATCGPDRIEVCRAEAAGDEVAAVRYSNAASGVEWRTEVVLWRGPTGSRVAVRVSREAVGPAERLDEARKPVIVRLLLERLGGGPDGDLPVAAKVHYLREDEVEIAARLMVGSAGCSLPVIYVSRTFAGAYHCDLNALSNDLAGLAHVVAEPSRNFSHRLKLEVGGQNAYGGAIGIYWSDGGARPTLLLSQYFENAQQMKREAIEAVRRALVHRRPTNLCTWYGVQEIVSHAEYEKLKVSGSRELNEFMTVFEAENRALKERLAEAELDNRRLRELVDEFKRDYVKRSGVTLDSGREQDFYTSEIRDILLAVIKNGIDQAQEDSRRQHVLKAVVAANHPGGEAERMRERLKTLLRDYAGMTGRLRRELEAMGFLVEQGGRHYKLTFRNDDRYTHTLATTPGAYTGNLNGISDINKRLF